MMGNCNIINKYMIKTKDNPKKKNKIDYFDIGIIEE